MTRHEQKQLTSQDVDPSKSLITSYIHAHAQDETVPTDVDSVDQVIGVGYLSMMPAQKLRVKRLKWLYEHIEKNPGKMTEELCQLVMSTFGLTFRTSGEYLRVLAGTHLAICFYGRWLTRKAYLSDPYWNPRKSSNAEESVSSRN